jgi:hypothetical protein
MFETLYLFRVTGVVVLGAGFPVQCQGDRVTPSVDSQSSVGAVPYCVLRFAFPLLGILRTVQATGVATLAVCQYHVVWSSDALRFIRNLVSNRITTHNTITIHNTIMIHAEAVSPCTTVVRRLSD